MIRPKFFILTVDLMIAVLALFLSHLLRFSAPNGVDALLDGGLFRVLTYLCIILMSAYFFELLEFDNFKSGRFILKRLLASLVTTFLILSIFFYLLPDHQFGRGVLLLSLCLVGLGQFGFRFLLRKYSRVSRFANRIFILGVGEYAQKMAKIITADFNPHSYVGFVSCGKEKSQVAEDRIVGDIGQFAELVQDYRPNKIIVALTERRGALPLKEIMHSKLRGVEVYDAATFYEQETGRLLVENVQPSAFIYAHGFRLTSFMRSYKRIFDVAFSVFGLFFAFPILPIAALAIKLDSPGPIFFKQLRVGEREVEYFIYKFRTMCNDAEKESGAVWAQQNDPRVTRIGQFMRKTRIDEIPQLYNVLKGDMSFVGPRPERLAFVDRLKKTIPYYSTRHFVKPGVTGWAQVCYPYGASEEDALEKLRYDLFYIKNYSVFLDFKIILDTVRVVLSGFGGR